MSSLYLKVTRLAAKARRERRIREHIRERLDGLRLQRLEEVEAAMDGEVASLRAEVERLLADRFSL